MTELLRAREEDLAVQAVIFLCGTTLCATTLCIKDTYILARFLRFPAFFTFWSFRDLPSRNQESPDQLGLKSDKSDKSDQF